MAAAQDIERLEHLSLVSKICTELENNIGIGDETLGLLGHRAEHVCVSWKHCGLVRRPPAAAMGGHRVLCGACRTRVLLRDCAYQGAPPLGAARRRAPEPKPFSTSPTAGCASRAQAVQTGGRVSGGCE